MNLSDLQNKINNFIVLVSDWASKISDLYFSSTPKSINIKVLDDKGAIVENTIPNWAKLQKQNTDFKTNILLKVPGFIFSKPNSNKTIFTKLSPKTFNISKGLQIVFNGFGINLSEDKTLSLDTDLDAGTSIPGTDYYVYFLFDGGFAISTNKTNPKNYTEENSICIGGFHYGLMPEAEAPNGNKTEADMILLRGINAYSFWDLKLMPENSKPEGKVLIQGTFWRDIYPADEDYAIRGFASCFALDKTPAKIAGGGTDNGRKYPKIPLDRGGDGSVNYGKLTYFNASEIVASVGAELISYAEFAESSYGIVEEKSANELGYVTNGVISHIPELTSKYGIEMAAGTQWFWTRELLNGYGNSDFANRTGLTDNRGYMYAPTNTPVAMLVGAQEQYTSTNPPGSRALDLDYYVWNSSWSLGFVGVCRNLKQMK